MNKKETEKSIKYKTVENNYNCTFILHFKVNFHCAYIS